MKAGVVHAKNDIRYEEIEKPKAGPGRVLIKVKYTGICGSDVPRVNGDACHYYPNVLGHEFSGTVVETGEGVTRVKPGDRVAGIPLVPCLKCMDCQRGDYSLCKHYSFIGSREFGSFAEYVSVPELNAVPFADNVSFEQGAFLKIFGAKKVVVFDIVDERLELGRRLGADAGINTLQEGFMEKAMELTGGRGFDYVYETAGNTITMKMAFRLAANKAGVCFIGTPTKELSFSVDEWECMNRKEFTLTGSWMSYSAPFPGKEWELTSYYFSTGQLKFDESFIYRKVPLSGIAEAFEWFKTPGKVKGKILIDSEA